jgi:hypothetical protein
MTPRPQTRDEVLIGFIEDMRSHGESLVLNWGEDTGAWEVSWITSGVRHVGISHDLQEACLRAYYKGRGRTWLKLDDDG